MSRTAPLCSLVLALALLAAPAAAAPPDRVPHELPRAGAHIATARTWIVGARAGAATARLARAHGARARRVPGAYTVTAGRARAFAAALRRRGLLHYSEPDRPLRRASAFEGGGQETGWARGFVVPAGLTPPPAPAPIGIVDDLVDAGVADTAQAKVVKGSATKQVLDGHGTAVASVAAGQANGTGVIGITPGAPLLSYGLKDNSCAEVADGILSVAQAGARVLNLSLGTTEDCFLLQLAIADAFATQTLVVAASGNEFGHGNPIVYPAAYPHVLSVGAVGVDMAPTYFSTANASVDLAAPGEGVPVAVPVAFDTRDGTADGISHEDGTSFAAPIVSGVASWLIGARPKLQPGQYADLLRHTAKDLGEPGWDSNTGFGLVDIAGALQAPTPPIDPLEPNDGITFVDGTAYSKPDPYVWKGAAARTIKASVDPVEDPVDVYRIRVGARRRAKLTLSAATGNLDLRVYDEAAKGLQSRPLARAKHGRAGTLVVHATNRTGTGRTFYVAVMAPSLKSRTFDAQYALKIARG